MRFTWALLGLLLVQPALATFKKEVVNTSRRKNALARNEANIRSELLAKAVPLKDYEAKKGIKLDRHLEEDEGQGEGGDNDDYYMNNNDMYSFSGYSMKYAKCQPIQFFSEDAVIAGEHSPMVTEDIVILRLCPQSSCSSSREYGCQYDFAEYAVELGEYVRIMLRYSEQKRGYMCDWCDECLGGDQQQRKLEEDGEEEDDEDENEQEDGEDENNEQEEQEEQQEEDEREEDEGNQANYENACNDWNTYCYNYENECVEDEGDGYLDYEGYLDYLDCSQVDYNGYAYFVRPRCDGTKGTIQMAVYYDNYCVQYAGNDVSINNLGLGFRQSAFEDFYSGECIDCSESEDPPYFDATSTLCNRLHISSAKCTSDLQYDLFEGEESDSTECSYIESLRFGTYDEYGQLSTSFSSANYDPKVTKAQKVMLILSSLLCVAFVIYACYLHHTMTNLLIKSLSHRELLPPSRQSNRRSLTPHSKGTRGRSKKVQDDPDWDGAKL